MELSKLYSQIVSLEQDVSREGLSAVSNLLYTALERNLQTVFDDLYRRVADNQGQGQGALTACIDILCSQAPLKTAGQVLHSKTFALGYLLGAPSGISLRRWDASEAFAEMLAQELGLEGSEVKVDSRLLVPEETYRWSPIDMHNHCKLVKSRALTGTVPWLDAFVVNDLEAPSGALEYFDCIQFVTFSDHVDGATALEGLEKLANRGVCFEWSEPWGTLEAQMLWAAPPWSGARDNLYEYHMARMSICLQGLRADPRLEGAEFQVFIALVQGTNGASDTLRISLLDSRGELVQGLVERDILYPNVYLAKLSGLLQNLNFPRVTVLKHAFTDKVVDSGSSHYRFFTLTQGWQECPSDRAGD